MATFNLRKFRLGTAKLNQKSFALKIDASRSTISNIEAGTQKITDSFLNKINAAFGIDVEPFKSYNQEVQINSELEKKVNQLHKSYTEALKTKKQLLNKYEDLLQKYGAIIDSNSKLETRIYECERLLDLKPLK